MFIPGNKLQVTIPLTYFTSDSFTLPLASMETAGVTGTTFPFSTVLVLAPDFEPTPGGAPFADFRCSSSSRINSMITSRTTPEIDGCRLVDMITSLTISVAKATANRSISSSEGATIEGSSGDVSSGMLLIVSMIAARTTPGIDGSLRLDVITSSMSESRRSVVNSISAASSWN